MESFLEGFDYNRFASDKKTLDAVVREVEIIGEAAKKLSNDFKSRYPDIPWKDIAGMREKLVHDYFSVDEEIVWEVATRDLRDLRTSKIYSFHFRNFGNPYHPVVREIIQSFRFID